MRRLFYFLGIALFFSTLALVGGLAGLLYGVTQYLPAVESLAYVRPSQTTKIYAADGTLLANLFVQNREVVPLSEIAKSAQEAVVAVEDARFYEHHGIDIIGILRAGWENVRHHHIVQGGSTLTQQMARAVFLSSQRTMLRKIKEALLALQIEQHFSKDEILKLYLNQVYFGEGAYGIEAAADRYFGKHAKELNVPEAALLAGLLRAPTSYSPYRNPKTALRRRNIVLQRMVEAGFLSPSKAKAYEKSPLHIRPKSNRGQILRAPYFTSYCIDTLIEEFGVDAVYKGGLRVYTTLDLKLQAQADKIMKQGIAYAKKNRLHISQGALVALGMGTGKILAMVGGVDFEKSEFNRAWQAKRQPGSAFKPFVYLAALDNGHFPFDVLTDQPVAYPAGGKMWSPQNYDHRYRGPITLYSALAYSVNVIAVKLAHEVGVSKIIEYVNRLGIDTVTQKNDANLALALGGLTYGVSPLQMAAAFAAFGNDGIYVQPLSILKVTNSDGFLIKEYAPESRQVVRPGIARTLTYMLSQVIQGGTGRRAQIGRPAAGKTGTTSDFRDAWFVGYTTDLATAVWLGNDDNSPTRHIAGGTLPAMLWADFMKRAEKGFPSAHFPKPPGEMLQEVSHKKHEEPTQENPSAATQADEERVTVEVCTVTGKRATPYCPGVVLKKFPKDKIPPLCPLHRGPHPTIEPPPPKATQEKSAHPTKKGEKMVQVDICTVSHKLANEYCPTVISRKMPLSQVPKEICPIHGPHGETSTP